MGDGQIDTERESKRERETELACENGEEMSTSQIGSYHKNITFYIALSGFMEGKQNKTKHKNNCIQNLVFLIFICKIYSKINYQCNSLVYCVAFYFLPVLLAVLLGNTGLTWLNGRKYFKLPSEEFQNQVDSRNSFKLLSINRIFLMKKVLQMLKLKV